ncbi:hypothetical protein EYB35_13435 [Bacillus paranthracis]|nr:hypothetical protein BCPR1_10730 [Bacillus paranthracis]TBL11267.1 hypothetical protein EYB35_13435 [Bacillus paranthracis]
MHPTIISTYYVTFVTQDKKRSCYDENTDRNNCLDDMMFHYPTIKYSYNLILSKIDYNFKRK